MVSRLRAITVKTLRVTVYVSVVAAGLGAVGVRAVHAKAQKAALAIGESLASVEIEGSHTVLTLNGHPLSLTDVHVDASVNEVLDRVQAACETHAEGLADDLADFERAVRRPPNDRGFPGIGFLRDTAREGHGVVSCFAAGAPVGHAEFVRRAGRFAESHDLADLGGLRYVAARPDEGGGARVTATWTDGHLDIGAMFPAKGDAPGEDPTAAPRPADARRLLSARVMPAPYGAFMYDTNKRPDAALADYERVLTSRGYERVRGPESGGEAGRGYRSGLVEIYVTATSRAERTSLTIIESHYATVTARMNAARKDENR